MVTFKLLVYFTLAGQKSLCVTALVGSFDNTRPLTPFECLDLGWGPKFSVRANIMHKTKSIEPFRLDDIITGSSDTWVG